jgi:Transposase IS116/IS110/IS902 family
MAAEIGDVARFRSARRLVGYAGRRRGLTGSGEHAAESVIR